MINPQIPAENRPRDVVDLQQIFQLIYKGKIIIISSVMIFLLLAFLYNTFSTPLYESSVVAKKEESSNTDNSNQLNTMFSMESRDKLNTEIEIIKSGTVLEQVIRELQLAFNIEEIDWHDETIQEFSPFYYQYKESVESEPASASRLPRFQLINIDYSFPGGEYLIQKSTDNSFEIINIQNDQKPTFYTVLDHTEIRIPGLQLIFTWPQSVAGDKMLVAIKNIEEVMNELKGNIRIAAVGETNLAKLTVSSSSPEMAMILANTIVEKYRNFRLDNKRQSVLSSYQFVNNQLDDIKAKLEKAENDLSSYKSENKIAIMDESSRDVLESLSNLESEKIKVDLSLGEYINKRNEMSDELKQKGYFDQTHLTPQDGEGRGTPFSILLDKLSDMEIKRLELLQRRTENHPEIITINEQIEQIKSKLAEYNENTLTSYNIIINSLRKKQSDLNQLIGRYSKKLENLPEKNLKLVQLTRTKNVYEKMFTLLLDKREEFRIAEVSKMQDIVIIEPAKIPHKPVKPKKVFNLIVSLILGLITGFIVIFVKLIFEKKVTSVDDTEKISPYPLLSIIPKYDRKLYKKVNQSEYYYNKLVTMMTDQNQFRESYRVLDLKVRNFSPSGSKALLITSCEENTGKTSIATNFAISLANKNKKVLLIDGDLRKANVASLLNDTNRKAGLINYLSDNIAHTHIINHLAIGDKNDRSLDYILAGGTVENSSELLESEKFARLIEKLIPKYDHILIDTPPITRIIDTLILGKVVRDLILVIKPNHTYKENIEMAIEELEYANMNVIGYIFNAFDLNKLTGKYKYGYGYAYGYPVSHTDNVVE